MPRVKKRSMTRVRFHCGKCGVAVTRPVRNLADRSRISTTDQTPFVPRATYTFTCADEANYGGWVVNLRDLMHSRLSRNADYGCCGVSPSVEKTRLCHRGHAFGWEVSECYTGSTGAWLDPECTTLSDSDGVAPFPFTLFDLAWSEANFRTGYLLARSLDNARAFGDLPVLADALEEGGCEDPVVLNHLRNPGTHRGGCWFVDQILGKA